MFSLVEKFDVFYTGTEEHFIHVLRKFANFLKGLTQTKIKSH